MPARQGAVHPGDVDVREGLDGLGLDPQSGCLDGVVATLAGVAAHVAQELLLAEEGTARHTGIPQGQHVDAAAPGRLLGREEPAHADADQAEGRHPGGGQQVGGRRHAGQPVVEAVRVGLLAVGVAGAVVVEAHDGQAERRQPVGQGPVGEVDAQRLERQGLAQHHAATGPAVGRQVHPAEERTVLRPEPKWRRHRGRTLDMHAQHLSSHSISIGSTVPSSRHHRNLMQEVRTTDPVSPAAAWGNRVRPAPGSVGVGRPSEDRVVGGQGGLGHVGPREPGQYPIPQRGRGRLLPPVAHGLEDGRW